MVSAPPVVQSRLWPANGAQLRSASTAASSHDLNGPRPAGTCTETLSQGSPCASDPFQLCEASRSCTTAMNHHGTPVRCDTAWYRALAVGSISALATVEKLRRSLAFAQRSAFAAFNAARSVIASAPSDDTRFISH